MRERCRPVEFMTLGGVGGPPGSLTGDDACVARVVSDRWRRMFTEEDGVRTAEAPTLAP